MLTCKKVNHADVNEHAQFLFYYNDNALSVDTKLSSLNSLYYMSDVNEHAQFLFYYNDNALSVDTKLSSLNSLYYMSGIIVSYFSVNDQFVF